MPYQFLTILRRYRDVETGALVPESTILSHSAALTEAGGKAMDDLADLVDSGEITPEDYIAGLRDEVRTGMVDQTMLGRGGRQAMTSRDWGVVGGLISRQYSFMDGFLADLQAGNLSNAQIRARGRLYIQSTEQGYERGHAAAFGVYFLPAFPRDLSSECQSGDRCRWRLEALDGDNNTDAYWELDPTVIEDCPTCLARALDWYPLTIRNGVLQPYTDHRITAAVGDKGHSHVQL